MRERRSGQPLTPQARALGSMRRALEQTQRDLGIALGLKDGSLVSQFEKGHKPLSHDHLQEIGAALGVPAEGVEVLLLGHGLLALGREEEAGGGSPSRLDLTAAERKRIWRTAASGGWTLAEALFAQLSRWKREEKLRHLEEEAEAQWAYLARLSLKERYDAIAVYPAFRTPALVARVCEASTRAAADKVKVAWEVAVFALALAQRLPGEPARRARAEGYAMGFVANALRVATDFDAADEKFLRAWKLWRKGDVYEPELLPEWRLHDLEASLRRAQHRFPAGLECLDRALVLCGGLPKAVAHILLNKEHLFSAMGDVEKALATLREAAPFVAALGDPHLELRLLFNTVDNLCTLNRFEEAESTLPALRELAIEQARELDLVRVVWLSAKVDAGQGRRSEALVGFEQVSRDFLAHNLPYEAALASLDRAALLLEAGNTAEAKDLALSLQRIFRTKKIAREALVALSLFCEAVLQESATVDSVRWAITEVERARRSASRA